MAFRSPLGLRALSLVVLHWFPYMWRIEMEKSWASLWLSRTRGVSCRLAWSILLSRMVLDHPNPVSKSSLGLPISNVFPTHNTNKLTFFCFGERNLCRVCLLGHTSSINTSLTNHSLVSTLSIQCLVTSSIISSRRHNKHGQANNVQVNLHACF
jgi:hypothetical protein